MRRTRVLGTTVRAVKKATLVSLRRGDLLAAFEGHPDILAQMRASAAAYPESCRYPGFEDERRQRYAAQVRAERDEEAAAAAAMEAAAAAAEEEAAEAAAAQAEAEAEETTTKQRFRRSSSAPPAEPHPATAAMAADVAKLGAKVTAIEASLRELLANVQKREAERKAKEGGGWFGGGGGGGPLW